MKVKGIKKPRFKEIKSANELKEREPLLFRKNNSLNIPEQPGMYDIQTCVKKKWIKLGNIETQGKIDKFFENECKKCEKNLNYRNPSTDVGSQSATDMQIIIDRNKERERDNNRVR